MAQIICSGKTLMRNVHVEVSDIGFAEFYILANLKSTPLFMQKVTLSTILGELFMTSEL